MTSANTPVPIVLCGAKVALGLESVNFLKPEFEGTQSFVNFFHNISLWFLKSDISAHRWMRLARRFLACYRTRNQQPVEENESWDTQLQCTSKSYSSRTHLYRWRSGIPTKARQRPLGSSQMSRLQRMRPSLPDMPPGWRRTWRMCSVSSAAPETWGRKVYTNILSRCRAVAVLASTSTRMQIMSSTAGIRNVFHRCTGRMYDIPM